MKQITAFMLPGMVVFGVIAFAISDVIHEKRKSRNHHPAAKLRDLYDDNAASGAAILEEGGDN